MLPSDTHPQDGSTPEFEAVIVIMGDIDAGKSRLINLIAGELIAYKKESNTADIQEYSCIYQDKDTDRTWKLLLLVLETGFCDNDPISETILASQECLDARIRKHRRSSIIGGMIYCYNIDRGDPEQVIADRLRYFVDVSEYLTMKNVVLCITQWEMSMDTTRAGYKFWTMTREGGPWWTEVFSRGARLAHHDNTCRSVEEILGLLIGKDAVKLLLLKELKYPDITIAGKVAFKQHYQVAKQIVQEMRSTQIKEARDRAEINRTDPESRWEKRLARLSGKLGRAKTAREKKETEQTIKAEGEDQERKRNMWEAIQRVRDERIEKSNAELCRRLTEATGLKFGDGIKEQELGYLGMGSKTAVRLSSTHHVNNHIVDSANGNLVPLQSQPFSAEYSRYVIPPDLASKNIQNVNHLLDELNEVFDTNIPISYPGIQKTLEYLISKGHDFGAVYARMQVIWPTLRLSVPSVSSKPFTDENPHYVIGSPELALRKCQYDDELLTFLNMSFDTQISLSPEVKEVLSFLVDIRSKFGDICVYMRYIWPRTPELEGEWLAIWKMGQVNPRPSVWEEFMTLERRVEEYEDRRQKSLRDNTIPNHLHNNKPRRIWDLYAHRVIPFQFSLIDMKIRYNLPNRQFSARFLHSRPIGITCYHPVSHSWTDDMLSVNSPVNSHEWPVPLPPGVTLEVVRNELLNLGAQYVWLDVVCLRQESLDFNHEALRMKEWKIDVPTIGKIYDPTDPSVGSVIRYLNGLGKVFRRNGWQDKRHWSQRAWTLQEVSLRYIEAGLPKGVDDLLDETDGNGTQLRDHLKIGEIRQGTVYFQNLIAAMKERHSKNPIDKIFGLSVLLKCSALLAYSEKEDEELAWARLIRTVNKKSLLELLFACPLPGKNKCYWRPSWRQLMEGTGTIEKLPRWGLQWWSDGKRWVKLDEGGRLNISDMALIERCRVFSFDFSVSTVLIKTMRGSATYAWTMFKLHAQYIAPGEYTLAGCNHTRYAGVDIDMLDSPSWVLCKPCPSGELEKVTVLRRPSKGTQESDVIGLGLDYLYRSKGRFLTSNLMCLKDVVFC